MYILANSIRVISTLTVFILPCSQYKAVILLGQRSSSAAPLLHFFSGGGIPLFGFAWAGFFRMSFALQAHVSLPMW